MSYFSPLLGYPPSAAAAGALVGKKARPPPGSGAGREAGQAGRQRREEQAEAGGCASTGDSTGKRSGVAVAEGLKLEQALRASAEWRSGLFQDPGQAREKRVTRPPIFTFGEARVRA